MLQTNHTHDSYGQEHKNYTNNNSTKCLQYKLLPPTKVYLKENWNTKSHYTKSHNVFN